MQEENKISESFEKIPEIWGKNDRLQKAAIWALSGLAFSSVSECFKPPQSIEDIVFRTLVVPTAAGIVGYYYATKISNALSRLNELGLRGTGRAVIEHLREGTQGSKPREFPQNKTAATVHSIADRRVFIQ